ncbi:MAG: phenylacetate--CoA ligase family protein [Candidatus Hodarchaeota archaeon]
MSNKIFEQIYMKSPSLIQNIFVTFFDIQNNIKRRGGKYKYWKSYYKKMEYKSLEDLKKLQDQELVNFLNFSVENSKFYKKYYQTIDIQNIKGVNELSKLPILEKEKLRENIQDIITIKKGILSSTGGTEGKALQVIFTYNDFQKRMALLDIFRENFGYKLGKRIAWFSGRNILNIKDEQKKRFWKTDYFYKIRYYSTFHLSENNLFYYIANLNKFKPSFISGFPSAIFEIANFSIRKNQRLNFKPIAIFTTSESLLPFYREIIEKAFCCKIFDQYSSAEGAPFIAECREGNLHYNLLSGVIEVVEDNSKSSQYGEMLVTSFSTHGTPLIRYKIGDKVKLSEKNCTCGLRHPVIEHIEGRETDFIFSKERGKLFNSQIGDCVKGNFRGIRQFQVVQNRINEIKVKFVVDNNYNKEQESQILKKFRERLGYKIKIELIYVKNIKKEASGKYKIIKNKISHLIN